MSIVPDSPTPARTQAQDTSMLGQEPVQTKKRKHQDVMRSLDQAMGSTPEDGERGPKRQHTSRSIYSTLAKYGITGKDATHGTARSVKPESMSKAPHLSAILAKTAAKTRKAMPFKLPFSSSSLTASTSTKDFSPSSTQAFLERLATFKPSTYTSKPEAIDSAAAARCGWTNDGKDRLLCNICSASWVVAGRDGMNRDAANALVEKQRGQMITQHKNLCPWRDRQCDLSIYTVQIKAPGVLARELKARSLALDPLLKDVNIQHPLTSSHIGAVQTILKALPFQTAPLPPMPQVGDAPPSPSPSITEMPIPEASETAVIVGLFGWSPAPPNPPTVERGRTVSGTRPGSAMSIRSVSRAPSMASLPGTRESTPVPEPSTPVRRPSVTPSLLSFASPRPSVDGVKQPENVMLHCALCQRRVGMWTFIPPPPVVTDSSETPTSTPARPVRARPNRAFDVLKEHRPYCPYVVRTTTLPSLPAAPGVVEPPRMSTASIGEDKVEGWRAVLSSICRYGLGQMRTTTSMDVPPPLGTQPEMDRVEAMVDRVKARGGKDLFKYVKGLLG